MGALAEFGRDLNRERTKARLEAAGVRGRTGGRPKGGHLALRQGFTYTLLLNRPLAFALGGENAQCVTVSQDGQALSASFVSELKGESWLPGTFE